MATAADRIRILLDRDPEPELPAPEHHGEFVTRDSGERKQWETGMQRDTNEDKIRPDLMFARYLPYHKQLIIRFMELMTRGAVKYDARNWEQAATEDEGDRYRESAIRHFFQWYFRQDGEEDHASAVIFNMMGAEYVDYQLEVAQK